MVSMLEILFRQALKLAKMAGFRGILAAMSGGRGRRQRLPTAKTFAIRWPFGSSSQGRVLAVPQATENGLGTRQTRRAFSRQYIPESHSRRRAGGENGTGKQNLYAKCKVGPGNPARLMFPNTH
jgi:hypothetical protein